MNKAQIDGAMATAKVADAALSGGVSVAPLVPVAEGVAAAAPKQRPWNFQCEDCEKICARAALVTRPNFWVCDHCGHDNRLGNMPEDRSVHPVIRGLEQERAGRTPTL